MCVEIYIPGLCILASDSAEQYNCDTNTSICFFWLKYDFIDRKHMNRLFFSIARQDIRLTGEKSIYWNQVKQK